MSPKAETSPTQKNSKRQDLTGKRFGQLTVLEYDTEKKKWKCQCDCGNLTYKTTGHLNACTATSCGCLKAARLHTGNKYIDGTEHRRKIERLGLVV